MDTSNTQSNESAGLDRNNYVAMVAHELRDPLMPIINAAAILKRMPVDVELVLRSAGIIERQARIMNRLIDDLLNVSRVQKAKLQLQRSAVTMGDIVEQALESMSPLFKQRGQRLLVTVAPEAMTLHADPLRLGQALRNLLANAAKFSLPDKEVLVRAYREHGEAVVTVADSGVGIDREEQESIFGLFTQAVRTRAPRANGGLGIGLYLARHFAEAHGGSLTVSSGGHGEGSTFMLRVPCLESGAGAVEPAQYSPSKRSVSFLTTA
jgi:signal transduction histidine kinase